MSEQIHVSPIAAYDVFAPYYTAYAETRRHYLKKVEEIVIRHVRGARSLLDVGAGDGSRTLQIAGAANIARAVLLEASAGMRARCPQPCETWPFGPLEIPDQCEPFEAITCLWNVLGHIQEAKQRVLVLSKLNNLLAPGGTMFLDVTHRYNAASYGWCKTLLRAAGDLLIRSDERGDVVVSWQAGEKLIRTSGHVFTHTEMKRLFAAAGLKIQNRWVISYESGRECSLACVGNLLYQVVSVTHL